MEIDEIIRYVAATCPGVEVVCATDGTDAGDTFFMYGEQQLPFATIMTKDYGDVDRRSHVDRPGVFRLSVGVGRATYQRLFGPPPSARNGRPPPGHDYAALDSHAHPVYAPQSFVCVLNPSAATFDQVKPLLAAAYQLAAARSHRYVGTGRCSAVFEREKRWA